MVLSNQNLACMKCWVGSFQRPNLVIVEEKFKCIKCKEPIIQPMQLQCGHRICKSCLDSLKTSNITLKCPSNDSDCEEITESHSQVFPDISFLKEMMRQNVFCKYHVYKCEFTAPWANINKHEQLCEYKEKCCLHCKEIIPIEEYKEHIEKNCFRGSSFCPYGCSKYMYLRAELENHKEACIMKPNLYKYETFKSNFQSIAKDDAIHKNDANEQLQMKRINTSDLDISCIQEIKDKINGLSTSLNDLKLDFQEKMTNISSFSKSSDYLIDDMPKRFLKYEETIAEHDKLLTSQDLRLQCLETANFNGELVWKITDFRRRKQQAINGQVLSLCSQQFFSNPYGYKMCAKVYLNGNGIGKSSHLSLFFVIMQGNFDDILTWPFCRKVTFILLDQKTNKRHLVYSFKPDKNSSSYQKPAASMNTAIGLPLFVPHTTLKNIDEIYLRNNSIFLRIKVDNEDL